MKNAYEERVQSERNQLGKAKTGFEPLKVYLFILLSFTAGSPLLIFAADKYQDMIDCDLHQGTCSKNLAGGTVTLQVDPKPVKAMKDLLFRITLSGNLFADVKTPYIDLAMPGMHMGPNRVILKSVEPGVYQGAGIIVRCPSGRRIWQATVVIPDIGRAEFIFDVIY